MMSDRSQNYLDDLKETLSEIGDITSDRTAGSSEKMVGLLHVIAREIATLNFNIKLMGDTLESIDDNTRG